MSVAMSTKVTHDDVKAVTHDELELQMDAIISGIQTLSDEIVNNNDSIAITSLEEVMSKFFTQDAQFTNAMGHHFPNLPAVSKAWSTWFSSLLEANDQSVDRVFNVEKLQAQWARSGTVTMANKDGGGQRFEFYDTLSAQFVNLRDNDDDDGDVGTPKLRICKLTSKLHRWEPMAS